MLTWSETVRKAFDGWKEVVESVLRVGKYTLDQGVVCFFEELDDVWGVLRTVATSLTPP